MSSLAGPLMAGNFWRRRATISCVSYKLSVVCFQCVDSGNGVDNNGAIWSLAGSADDLLVVAMPNQYNRAFFARKLQRLQVHLGDQRARRIDHSQGAIFGFLPNRRGNPMSAEHQHAAVRNVANGFDENCAAPP